MSVSIFLRLVGFSHGKIEHLKRLLECRSHKSVMFET